MEQLITTLVGLLASFGVLTPTPDVATPITEDTDAGIVYEVDEERFVELKEAIATIQVLEAELDEAGSELDIDGDGIIDSIEDEFEGGSQPDIDDGDAQSEDLPEDADIADSLGIDELEEAEGEKGLGSIFLADSLAERLRGWDNMSETAKERLKDLKEKKALGEVDIVQELEEGFNEIVEEIEKLDEVNDAFESEIKTAKAKVKVAELSGDTSAVGRAQAELESAIASRRSSLEALTLQLDIESLADVKSLADLDGVAEQVEEILDKADDETLSLLPADVTSIIPSEVQSLLPDKAKEVIGKIQERTDEARDNAEQRYEDFERELEEEGLTEDDIDKLVEEKKDREKQERERIADELERAEERIREELDQYLGQSLEDFIKSNSNGKALGSARR